MPSNKGIIGVIAAEAGRRSQGRPKLSRCCACQAFAGSAQDTRKYASCRRIMSDSRLLGSVCDGKMDHMEQWRPRACFAEGSVANASSISQALWMNLTISLADEAWVPESGRSGRRWWLLATLWAFWRPASVGIWHAQAAISSLHCSVVQWDADTG